ncbi:MAG: histidine kinase dimerization/phospho-acceptor domain-containing protein [Bacteroidia bacterium]
MINQLREKNDELLDTNSELERFTYIASHDLKSPLRTIINFLEVIEHNIKKQRYDQLVKTLKHVKSGAQQMNFLVSDILEYSSINNQTLERETLDLNQIVEKAKTNLQVEIEKKMH